MKTITRILMAVWILQSSTVLSAQVDDHTESSLPSLSPGVRYGQLDNGLRYYIKPLPKVGSRVSMRLYIKVGKFQEDPDQWQMAHFMEHMSFVRTPNFTSLGVNFDILSSMGMKQGDVFALTGGNFTNYWFDFPSPNPKALTNGLLWFHDIISGSMQFRKEDIDGERGPFFQEYLFRNGRGGYFDKKISEGISDCFTNPVYPNDFKQYVQVFNQKDLIRFYKDWYRPDLSAIIIVGDVHNIDSLEIQIRKSFSDIGVVKDARTRVDCAKEYLKRSDQFIALEDSLKPSKSDESNSIRIHSFIRDYGTIGTNSDSNKSALAMAMLKDVINRRIRQASESSYNTSYHIRSNYEPSGEFPAIEMKLEAKEEKVRESVEFIAAILRHIKVRGINETEWDSMKRIEVQKLKDVGDTAKYWLDHIGDHFILERPLPKNKNLILQNWLKNLSLTDINRILSESIPNMIQDIVVIAPKGSDVLELSEREVRNWILEINRGPVMDISSEAEISSLMDADELDRLNPVSYIQKENPKFGVKEILLGNGVKVVLQNGGFKDNIAVHGFSPIGTSSFPRKDFYSLINAPSIVRNTGVDMINKFQLNKYLGKTSIPLTVMPYMEYAESGIKGESDHKDLEKLMQVIYLYFTAPRKDPNAFTDWQNMQKDRYHKQSNETLIYKDMLNEIMDKISNDSIIFHPNGGTKHYKGINEANLDQVYKAYSQIFGNARDFTFLISGNYKEKKVLYLIRKYLGNLPNLHKSYENMEPTMEHRLRNVSIVRLGPLGLGSENTKIRIKYIYPTDGRSDWREKIRMEFLSRALNAKLDRLRYVRKRDVFSTRAHQWYYTFLGWNVISIDMECSIEDTEIVRKDINEIIHRLKNEKLDKVTFHYIAETYYNKYNASTIRSKAKKMQEKIYRTIRFGEPYVSPEVVEGYVRSLTPEDILISAKKILDDRYYSEFILKGLEKEVQIE